MRIAFNGQRLAGQRLGVGRYIEYLLRYWSEMLDDDEVSLFLRRPLEDDAREYLALSPQIDPTVISPDLPGIAWENLRLRGPASKTDVLFCPAYTAPAAYRHPLVVATHSANEVVPGAHSWRYRQTYVRLYRASARAADAVIVPAEVTKQDVVETLGLREDRTFVVPQGADDAFAPMTDEEQLEAVRRRYFGSNRPYILFVGKCSVRRNIPLLIRAFAKLRHDRKLPHGLLLFGPNVANLPLLDLVRELGLTDDVVQTDGKITDHRELVPIYNAADVFAQPSLYEGWSMTTVEALACGTAVVAANRGGLAEAVAGHGLMLDDVTEDTLADAIELVATNGEVRRDLERKAVERGKSLRWEDTARLTLEVVRLVVEGR